MKPFWAFFTCPDCFKSWAEHVETINPITTADCPECARKYCVPHAWEANPVSDMPEKQADSEFFALG